MKLFYKILKYLWTASRFQKTGKLLLIMTAAVFCSPVFSVIARAEVTGIIVHFDKESVTLSQRGKQFKIPRKSIPQHIRIRSGKRITVEIDSYKNSKTSK